MRQRDEVLKEARQQGLPTGQLLQLEVLLDIRGLLESRLEPPVRKAEEQLGVKRSRRKG